MSKLYNLFWNSALERTPHAVPLQSLATIERNDLPHAVILWPAFFTPSVHVRPASGAEGATDRFYLLLQTIEGEPGNIGEMVNRQLKVSIGLDADKRFTAESLFEVAAPNIEVSRIVPEVVDGRKLFLAPPGSGSHPADCHFRGVLHPAALKGVEPQLNSYYWIAINAACLPRPGSAGRGSRCNEYQDVLMMKTLDRINGAHLRPVTEQGVPSRRVCKGFSIRNGEPDLAHRSHVNRICAYHPLLILCSDEAESLRLAHVTDMHINSRQDILARSPARIIEFGKQATQSSCSVADAPAASPPIGPLVNRYAKTCGAILESVAAHESNDGKRPQLVLIGGDLMDHADNAFDRGGATPLMTASEVWNAVSMDGNYTDRYESNRFVDLTVAWSLFKAFVDKHGIPLCGITGNHDAYKRAYGVSPRIAGHKANEGIPADHNLTFLEALIIFGPSYDFVKWNVGNNATNFYCELLDWFYAVFTPFASYSIAVGGNRVLALGWGDDEVMLTPEGQGFGHLPTANTAPHDADLRLVEIASQGNVPTVLLSHYTFVSFDGSIPFSFPKQVGTGRINSPMEQTISVSEALKITGAQMGTFTKSRKKFVHHVFKQGGPIRCVLTGHSHRKGRYELVSASSLADDMCDRITVASHDLDEPATIYGLTDAPVIILSDSAGPVPRRNDFGEFGAWGSDQPSGTFLELVDGTVQRIMPIKPIGVAKPRSAVVVDYLHSMNNAVFSEFAATMVDDDAGSVTANGVASPDHPAADCRVYARLNDGLSGRPKVSIAAMTFCAMVPAAHGPGRTDAEWLRLDAIPEQAPNGDPTGWWTIPDGVGFSRWIRAASQSGRYLSLRFQTDNSVLRDRYDWGSEWHSEIVTGFAPTFPGQVRYTLTPSTDPPDFAWRKKLQGY